MMRHLIARTGLLAVVVAVSSVSAQAQYVYPGGYGGWGGWGGGGATVGGNAARGMGVYAAGAGAYNVQTAQARSINANTAMQANDYMYAITRRNAANEMQHMARRKNDVNETAEKTYSRLHDNPDAGDIHRGDALNVVLDELTNPEVYSQVVQKATQPVSSDLIKNIPFQYAAKMITISLEDVSARGMPDTLATDAAFTDNRAAVKELVTQAKKEAESDNQISIDTLRKCRAAIQAWQEKVASTYDQGTRNRSEADNYLKALYGLTKMLETPAVDKFLKGLNKYDTTSLGRLITFMHNFNLRFGATKSPAQEGAYDQLYPMLVKLRDSAQVRVANPVTAQAPNPDPKKMVGFFSGMHYDHFKPQPDPHTNPAPPPPGSQP